MSKNGYKEVIIGQTRSIAGVVIKMKRNGWRETTVDDVYKTVISSLRRFHGKDDFDQYKDQIKEKIEELIKLSNQNMNAPCFYPIGVGNK